jgi:MtfA peptidase
MGLNLFRPWRRKRLMAEPLDPDWLAIIERNVPYYRCLGLDMRRRMHGLVQVFLDEKSFEGCGGIEISDEIRVTVAAHACILLLGLDVEQYPKLRSVLLYPGTYVAPLSRRGPGGVITEGIQVRSGESWSQGNVVLSWGDVLQCASPNRTGRNVVLHEFAHQLDSESGSNEGAPLLPHQDMYANWARVLGSEYQLLIDAAERGEPTLLDPYGATSPAEFFAVATECFFEKPVEMLAIHPELYEQLKQFYRQDPALLAGRLRGGRY